MTNSALMNEPTPSQAVAPAAGARIRTRVLLKGIAFAGAVMVIAEALRIFVGTNFHTVVPGRCYRSAQPTPAFLENAKRIHGIRTIINLRGENEAEPWYQAEKEAAQRLGIELMDPGLSSKEDAPDDDFRIFVQAMKDAQEPILIHCANGNDRSGLASAVYLIMRTDTPIAVARHQLGLRYGHIPIGKVMCLHRVLDNYEAWLQENGHHHTAEHFYHWGTQIYRAEIEN